MFVISCYSSSRKPNIKEEGGEEILEERIMGKGKSLLGLPRALLSEALKGNNPLRPASSLCSVHSRY